MAPVGVIVMIDESQEIGRKSSVINVAKWGTSRKSVSATRRKKSKYPKSSNT